jgi:uncharacterized membrane protein
VPLSPTKIFFTTVGAVGASTAALPSVTGYGTVLFQLVALGAWSIVAAVTSGAYADTHHPMVWAVALVLNLTLFVIPASGIWLASHKRWPVACAGAILAWCAFYLACLFWLFPATDGP